MKKVILVTLGILVLTQSAWAKVRIKDLDFTKPDSKPGHVLINFNGDLSDTPELMIRDDLIQVTIKNAVVYPTIEKKVTIGKKPFDTTITAYQYNKKTVRFRATLPYSMKGHEGKVSLVLKDGKIDLQFPKLKIKKKKPMFAAYKAKKKRDSYDESFLDKLLKDKGTKVLEKRETPPVKKMKNAEPVNEDQVRMALAGNEKKSNKSRFSLSSYVGKMVALLGAILLVFYLIVNFFKKGVLKKGKLGFLNNTQVVSVLNTTYIAPKKSLIMVKVHNQVLLLGSDEKGLHFLSEVKDTVGLMKDGEKGISGSNFDTSLLAQERNPKEFKLKEVEEPEIKKASLSEFLDENPVEDKVRLSDQIKSKVKNLKQLQ